VMVAAAGVGLAKTVLVDALAVTTALAVMIVETVDRVVGAIVASVPIVVLAGIVTIVRIAVPVVIPKVDRIVVLAGIVTIVRIAVLAVIPKVARIVVLAGIVTIVRIAVPVVIPKVARIVVSVPIVVLAVIVTIAPTGASVPNGVLGPIVKTRGHEASAPTVMTRVAAPVTATIANPEATVLGAVRIVAIATSANRVVEARIGMVAAAAVPAMMVTGVRAVPVATECVQA